MPWISKPDVPEYFSSPAPPLTGTRGPVVNAGALNGAEIFVSSSPEKCTFHCSTF